MLIYGLNPVLEALRAGRARKVFIVGGADASSRRVGEVEALARAGGVPVSVVQPAAIERLARGGVHQGVAAEIETPRVASIADLVRQAAGPALIVVLDGIEDPHNVGAIVRTADAAGAHGLVRQSRRAAPLGGAAAKASAGAVAYLPIVEVVNISRALEELKNAGVWTLGLASEAAAAYDQTDLALPTAVVLGAEGTGLRRLVRERCDQLVSIPMRGHVDSLNVSVAAGVVLFEALRQRRAAGRTG